MTIIKDKAIHFLDESTLPLHNNPGREEKSTGLITHVYKEQK